MPCPTDQCAKWTLELEIATTPVVRHVMGSYTRHFLLLNAQPQKVQTFQAFGGL